MGASSMRAKALPSRTRQRGLQWRPSFLQAAMSAQYRSNSSTSRAFTASEVGHVFRGTAQTLERQQQRRRQQFDGDIKRHSSS